MTLEQRERESAENRQQELIARITNYLGNGGLFNPELMEHEKVRNLLMDCRDELMLLRCQNCNP